MEEVVSVSSVYARELLMTIGGVKEVYFCFLL